MQNKTLNNTHPSRTNMKNLTTYIVVVVLSVLFGFLAGMHVQKIVVENECSKLGGFYFGNNVYQCVSSK
jgi:hypothetical protein